LVDASYIYESYRFESCPDYKTHKLQYPYSGEMG
jgi:hypothetical protein